MVRSRMASATDSSDTQIPGGVLKGHHWDEGEYSAQVALHRSVTFHSASSSFCVLLVMMVRPPCHALESSQSHPPHRQ